MGWSACGDTEGPGWAHGGAAAPPSWTPPSSPGQCCPAEKPFSNPSLPFLGWALLQQVRVGGDALAPALRRGCRAGLELTSRKCPSPAVLSLLLSLRGAGRLVVWAPMCGHPGRCLAPCFHSSHRCTRDHTPHGHWPALTVVLPESLVGLATPHLSSPLWWLSLCPCWDVDFRPGPSMLPSPEAMDMA